jgi:predicted protein tyrosine phosphatase
MSATFSPNLDICAVDEVNNFSSKSLTHMISIRNPGSPSAHPSWFQGSFLELFFGDVISPADAHNCRTLPPATTHLKEAIDFTRAAFSCLSAKTLIFCDYGASRSPALGYVVLAAQGCPGTEAECFQRIIQIRPDAVPNLYVIRLGDFYLSRKGALLAPCQKYLDELFKELT